MPNRFQDLINNSSQTTMAILPGVNRFSNLVEQPQTNRFADLIIPEQKREGVFKKTIKSFGGTIGTIGRILTAGQAAVTGIAEKGLEKIGVLRDTDIKGTGAKEGIKEQKSNIELIKRVGQETGKGGLLTGVYTPSISVFGNFIRELPSTAIGLTADLLLDPLVVASKLKIISKGTAAIGKGIETGAKVLAKEIPAVQKVGDMLGRAFLTRYGQSEAFKNLDIARKVEESLVTEKIGKLVSDVIDKPAAIQQRITQIIKGEIPEIIIKKPVQKTGQITSTIGNLFQSISGESTFLPYIKTSAITPPLTGRQSLVSLSKIKPLPDLDVNSFLKMSPSNLKKDILSIQGYSSILEKESQVNKLIFDNLVGKLAKKNGIKFESRLKTMQSLVGKVKRYLQKNRHPAEIADNIAGQLIIDGFNNIKKVKPVFDKLQVFEVEDYVSIMSSPWGYRGINTKIKLPNGGIAEIQVHNPVSLRIRKTIHPIYEKWRDFKETDYPIEMIQDMEKSKKIADKIWNEANVGIKEVSPKLDITDNELKILAEPIRQELDRVGESISKLNPKLLSEETFQANKGTYFPRLYTDYEFPATEEGLIKQAFGSKAVNIPKEPFKKRVLTEAESLAKGTRIEEAGYPAAKRLTQLEITETRQKFFKDVAKLASDEAKPGWLQLSEDKALGDLAGKFLPAAEYKAIAEIRKIPGPVEQLYNKALTTWKTFKTAYNPSTISRNDLTNYFILNPLGGVGPHRLDIYAKAVNELLTKGNLYQLARREGLEISTQQAAELMNQASKFYKKNKGLVGQFFGKIGDFHNVVKNFYGSQDKFFKLANFIKGVTEDGLTPQKALQRANFYLVDYSEVPEFINWARKSPIGIPFISFTYGVSKPLAKTLLERPDKLGAYFKILNGIQQMNPMGETPQERQAELDTTPDWIQQGTTLRLPLKDKYGRGQYVDLQYILPFNILESKSITPSSPLLTMMASMLTNKDTFTGKDITMQTDTTEEKTSKWAKYIIKQIVPSLAPFGYSWEKVKALLQNRPDANGYVRKVLPVLIDVLAGIKIIPIDQTIEAQKRAYEKQKELEELRSNLIRIQTDKTLLLETKIEETKKIQEKINKVFQ